MFSQSCLAIYELQVRIFMLKIPQDTPPHTHITAFQDSFLDIYNLLCS